MLKKIILKQSEYIHHYNKKLDIHWSLHQDMYIYLKKICMLECYIYDDIKKNTILKEQRIFDNWIQSFKYINKQNR